MAALFAKSSGPMAEIDTTPLIDVMLAMPILFIITIPAAMHSVEVDVPSGPPRLEVLPKPDKNRIVLTGQDRLLWNGEAVGQARLARLLAQTRAMTPEPVLEFQPEADVAYDLSARTLAAIERSQVTGFGFVGNEAYAEFGKPVQPR